MTIVSRTNTTSSFASGRIAHNVVRPSGAILARSAGGHQQSRAFRLGLWSSYLDPIFQKEFQRRRRTLQRKYLQAVNRKLGWDAPRDGYLKQSDLKGFMSSTWRGHDPRPGGRWVNVDGLGKASYQSQPDPSSGVGLGQGAPGNLFDQQDGVNGYVHTPSPLFARGWNNLFTSKSKSYNNLQDLSQATLSRSGQRQTSKGSLEHTSIANQAHILEYEIDPITNRKVLKHNSRDSSGAVPVGQTIFDLSSRREPVFEEYNPAVPDEYEPFRFNEPDGKSPEELKSTDPVQESLREYERRTPNEYESFRFNEPDGKSPEELESTDPVQESLKEYERFTPNEYNAFRFNEPDGKFPEELNRVDPVRESLKDYETLTPNEYDAFRFNEPDGKSPEELKSVDPVQESLKDYERLAPNQYRAFRYNEPDGKSPEELQSADPIREGLKDYERLFPNAYGPFRYNEPDGKTPEQPCPVKESLREYEAASEGYKAFRYNEPDGKPPADVDPLKESLKEYEHLANDPYKPFRYNEPDGKPPTEVDPLAESLKDYESLAKGAYEPFRYNEPDGQPLTNQGSTAKSLNEYDVLAEDAYKPFRYNEPDGKPPTKDDPIAKSLNEYDFLAKDAYRPFQYNEPDGKPPSKEDLISNGLNEYDIQAKDAYKPFRYNEPDGKPPSKNQPVSQGLNEYDTGAEGAYRPFRYNEPDGKPLTKDDHTAKSLNDYDVENTYKPFQYNEPDGKPAEMPDSLKGYLKDYDSFSEGYKPFRYNEPDGKPAEMPDSLKGSLKVYESFSEGYKPFRYNEPDGKPPKISDPLEESLKDYESFSEGYKPFKYNEPDGRPFIHPDIVEKDLANLNKSTSPSYARSYSATAFPTRLYTPFDSSMDPQFNSFDYSSSQTTQKANDETSARRQKLENDYLMTRTSDADEVAAAESVKNTKKLTQDLKSEVGGLEDLAAATRSRIDAKIAEIEGSPANGSSKKKLTGNFVHDFPEDFKASWTAKGSGGSLTPKDPTAINNQTPEQLERLHIDKMESAIQNTERAYSEGEASQNPFSTDPNTPRLETSLDRYTSDVQETSRSAIDKTKLSMDPYSKEPQGLETAYDEECGNGQPVYMSTYESSASDAGASKQQPSSTHVLPVTESRNKQKKT